MADAARDAAVPHSPPASSGVYDGVAAASLAARWGVPLVLALDTTTSTLDDAHRLAEQGAPHAALVVADRQTGGRGRQGKPWQSAAGQGIWLTMLARGLDAVAVNVLSIRLGLALAAPLDRFAAVPVQLKWPNDIHLGGRKLVGMLAEARWQGARAAWVAIGVGVNVRAPDAPTVGAALCDGTSRIAVLDAIVPALVGAARRSGPLDATELTEFAARDLAAGRRCTSPCVGRVVGLAADGGLMVETARRVRTIHAGSLVLDPA